MTPDLTRRIRERAVVLAALPPGPLALSIHASGLVHAQLAGEIRADYVPTFPHLAEVEVQRELQRTGVSELTAATACEVCSGHGCPWCDAPSPGGVPTCGCLDWGAL